ncbi:MAG: NAD(P)H-hydrate dehydratase [Archaeoglobaceae archaeon]|nr:NAD(P)H-hydrate dehydratase [Archaeoglobaceae archaeon]MDW8014011.1 NAD(P)H-hydrate dehydratase [Archaeoglobaceae archaeon]
MITSREMRIIDMNCEFFGLNRIQLMENAGKAVADEIVKRFEPCKVTVVAGPGNNGGDSFVAARHLRGFDVEVYVVERVKSMEAKKNLEILERAGFKIFEGVPRSFGEVVVDGMFGTGFKGFPREPFSSAIDEINKSGAFVVSVDIPSGLDADTGKYSKAVKANLTVTFHKIKPGIIKAKEICGEVVVANIGIPETFEKICGIGDVVECYKRFPDAHKGMHGRVLVVGGGEYTGAPALASLASLAAGADVVTTVVPEKIRSIVASFSPNLIVRGIDFRLENLKHFEELVKKHHVMVAGMGVGDESFKEFVSELLKSCKKAVLDAQGIIDDVPENVECVMTPHRGEFRKVFGDLDVRDAARKSKSVILLKGREDVITDGERIKVNRSGNPGMTVGGTGDVLAGVVGAFMCNDDAFHAACASAFLNGFAGDMCCEKIGYNFTAMDLINEIPKAIKKCFELAKVLPYK